MSFQLPHIISWAHRFAEEILKPGDLAVDLTAGKGRDTLMLYRCVSPGGRVLAFDIQQQALCASAELLGDAGVSSVLVNDAERTDAPAGVQLIHADHARLADYLDAAPKVVMANFGYLPGGDPEVITRSASSCTALEVALDLLAPGGRLVCVLYTAHPGGDQEAAAVEALLASLSSRDWFVLRLQVGNRCQAPYLLVAEKR